MKLKLTIQNNLEERSIFEERSFLLDGEFLDGGFQDFLFCSIYEMD
jgi:hypothetical protein